MAVKYLAGDRIIGTAAERAALTVDAITSSNWGTHDTSTVSGQTIVKFTSSGHFRPTSAYNVEYLVVGGGGGSGAQIGGGGGAGGYRVSTSNAQNHAVTAQTYTITVGAGGIRADTSASRRATNGGNSTFDTITSAGGGFGADNDISPYTDGNAGGSGGGGTYRGGAEDGGAGNTPSTSPSQGSAGGSKTGSTTYGAAGGGGAGGVGQPDGSSTSGAGGVGIQNDITGTNLYYAGGGGGGSHSGGSNDGGLGGSGGGGRGGDDADASTAGTNGLGGGGGGGSTDGTSQGKDGGSGVVILRFSTSGNGVTTSDVPAVTFNTPNGTIFEESDTGKHYMFDGSQTWNEM